MPKLLSFINTFITLGPILVYLCSKRIEDCLQCFNKCSTVYSKHQVSIHDKILKEERARSIDERLKTDVFAATNQAPINYYRSIGESDYDLSFDDQPMTFQRNVFAESRNSITVLLEEFGGCRSEESSTFIGQESRESIYD